jgi:RNA polymerase sigma-70 factor (ECF subfamily)
MGEYEWIAERFEEGRPHLRAVAYRMLGSLSDAEDAVQEAWLRLSRANTDGIENLTAWMTTIVSRVCLDMLRTRKSRREEALDSNAAAPAASSQSSSDPEQEALLADSVGLALLVVLDKLAPAERIAFVLHDVFAVPFEEIAPIVDRSPATTRQLASRARRRVQGTSALPRAALNEQRQVVDAFLAASRGGNFDALLAVLDQDVVFRADEAAMRLGGPKKEVRGAKAIAKLFCGRAQAATAALVDGEVGILVAPAGRLFLLLLPTVKAGKIVQLEAIAEPQRLGVLEMAVLPEESAG